MCCLKHELLLRRLGALRTGSQAPSLTSLIKPLAPFTPTYTPHHPSPPHPRTHLLVQLIRPPQQLCKVALPDLQGWCDVAALRRLRQLPPALRAGLGIPVLQDVLRAGRGRVVGSRGVTRCAVHIMNGCESTRLRVQELAA